MLGSVMAILARFASPSGDEDVDGSGRERTDGETAAGAVNGRSRGGREGSSLYECPSCERVYVAVERDDCTACDVAVDEVPRTI